MSELRTLRTKSQESHDKRQTDLIFAPFHPGLSPGLTTELTMGFIHNSGERRIVGKDRSARKNTGWKPMLHWSSGLPSDLSEPSWELSPCTWSSDATALM